MEYLPSLQQEFDELKPSLFGKRTDLRRLDSRTSTDSVSQNCSRSSSSQISCLLHYDISSRSLHIVILAIYYEF